VVLINAGGEFVKLSNKMLKAFFMGSVFASTLLIADVPMPSQVPMITTVRPTQQYPQSGATSNVSVHKATFVDPSTGMLVVYEVATFENASGQTIEQYTNTQTGHVSSRVIQGS